MDRNIGIVLGVLVLIAIAGGVFLFNGSQNKSQQPIENQLSLAGETPSASPKVTTKPMGSPAKGAVKSFTVTGTNFAFDPKTITVNKGDTVKINFENSEGIHNLAIDELNVRTKTIREGQSETLEFMVSKAGQFTYYCSVGNHAAMGMIGTLVVR